MTKNAVITSKEQKAFLGLLSHVILGLRQNSVNIGPQQLFDIMDAIHNIPGRVSGIANAIPDREFLGLFFVPYDSKWYGKTDDRLGISLVHLYEYYTCCDN